MLHAIDCVPNHCQIVFITFFLSCFSDQFSCFFGHFLNLRDEWLDFREDEPNCKHIYPEFHRVKSLYVQSSNYVCLILEHVARFWNYLQTFQAINPHWHSCSRRVARKGFFKLFKFMRFAFNFKRFSFNTKTLPKLNQRHCVSLFST